MKQNIYEVIFGDITRIEYAFNVESAMILAQAKQINAGLKYEPDSIYLIKTNGIFDVAERELVWFKTKEASRFSV